VGGPLWGHPRPDHARRNLHGFQSVRGHARKHDTNE
jgi:hypothetical protein